MFILSSNYHTYFDMLLNELSLKYTFAYGTVTFPINIIKFGKTLFATAIIKAAFEMRRNKTTNINLI